MNRLVFGENGRSKEASPDLQGSYPDIQQRRGFVCILHGEPAFLRLGYETLANKLERNICH